MEFVDVEKEFRRQSKLCDSREGGLECHTELEACWGYAFLLAAGRDEDSTDRELLCRALPHLKKAYFKLGRSEAGAVNLALAYQGLGEHEAAGDVLTDYAYSTATDTVEFLIAAGQAYLLEDDLIAQAKKVFREANGLQPSNPTPVQWLLELRGPRYESRPGKLRKDSDRFRLQDLPRLARQGYEEVLHSWGSSRYGLAKEHSTAEPALVGWVHTVATIGNVSLRDLERLPTTEAWPHPARVELDRLLRHPTRGSDELKWWTKKQTDTYALKNDSVTARSAMANLLLDLSRSHLAAGRLADAQILLESSFELSEFEDDFDDPGAFLRLDVAGELGRLYLVHRAELDPNGSSFEDLVGKLTENLDEIDDHGEDLRLLEEYHAAIGTLLIEESELYDSTHPATTNLALEHLEEALRIDGKLWQFHAEYALPQPRIEMLVGDLRCRHKARCEGSFDAYLAAAKGFLDRDLLDGEESVEAALTQAREVPGDRSPEQLKSIELLETILDLRQHPQSWLEWDENNVLAKASLELDPENLEDLKNPEAGFLRRQRFKVLVDAGRAAQDAGELELALRLHIDAIRTLAVLRMLPSGSDLTRMETALTTVLSANPVLVLGSGLSFKVPFLESAYYHKELALPHRAGRPGIKLQIGDDVFLAAELRGFLLDSQIDPPATWSLNLTGRQLHLFPGEAAEEAQTLKRRIEAKKLVVPVLGNHLRITSVKLRKNVRNHPGVGLRKQGELDPLPPDCESTH